MLRRTARWLLFAVTGVALACSGTRDDAGQARNPSPVAPVTSTPMPASTPDGAQPSSTPVPATPLPPEQQPAEVVQEAVAVIARRYFEELPPGALFSEAWEGAAAALRQAGVADVPAPPSYPRDFTPAAARHREAFPALERLAEGRLSRSELTSAAIREIVHRRHECHTSYVPADALKAATTRPARGEVVTTGLGFGPESPPRVVVVLPGSPAQAAGFRRGQAVLVINGRSVEGLTGAEAETLLDTREGVTNTLTVRDPDGRTRDLTVAAAVLRLPLEEHTILPGNVGLIRFYTFPTTNQLPERLRAILTEFEAQGVRGWIVDLRENSGGAVTTAVAVASLFVERGRLFRVQPRETVATYIEADGSVLPFQRPLVFLVGPGSASAAEIVPGALRALGRATLVGERTGGCIGRSQGIPLADRSLLFVTDSEVVIGPEGQRLNGVGVTPDIVAARTPEDEQAGRDPQLAAAIRVIEQRVAGR